mmetsp:Transcript_8081/g.16845  ORF Transcript_8081/g.16845 Transcript_8081/m.16845 type:complete len:308 (+) Transcript_8081:122-1045(+)
MRKIPSSNAARWGHTREMIRKYWSWFQPFSQPAEVQPGLMGKQLLAHRVQHLLQVRTTILIRTFHPKPRPWIQELPADLPHRPLDPLITLHPHRTVNNTVVLRHTMLMDTHLRHGAVCLRHPIMLDLAELLVAEEILILRPVRAMRCHLTIWRGTIRIPCIPHHLVCHPTIPLLRSSSNNRQPRHNNLLLAEVARRLRLPDRPIVAANTCDRGPSSSFLLKSTSCRRLRRCKHSHGSHTAKWVMLCILWNTWRGEFEMRRGAILLLYYTGDGVTITADTKPHMGETWTKSLRKRGAIQQVCSNSSRS